MMFTWQPSAAKVSKLVLRFALEIFDNTCKTKCLSVLTFFTNFSATRKLDQPHQILKQDVKLLKQKILEKKRTLLGVVKRGIASLVVS